jgi:hypothetical protein
MGVGTWSARGEIPTGSAMLARPDRSCWPARCGAARYVARELPPDMRAPILKAYLDRYATEVQRFFPVAKGSAVEAFNDLAARYPVFELLALNEEADRTGGAF